MPPVTTLPYGPAPTWCFPLTETCMYVLFVLCLWHALRRGIKEVSYLLAGVLFGLLLEYIDVISNQGYVYGKFIVMFGKPPMGIPFWIGVGWGCIMYTARLFTDTFKLPLWAGACLDALLALSIDISMDVVAYRLHMWTWDYSDSNANPLTAQWFGVPYGNFSGWLYVVFFYSSISRLLERWLLKNKQAINLKLAVIPLIAVLLSQVALWVTMVNIGDVLRSVGLKDGTKLLLTLLILAFVIVFSWRKKKRTEPSMPLVAWLVPVWFHLYFFAWLFIGGFYKESALMVVASAASLLLGIFVHLRYKNNEYKTAVRWRR